MVLTVIDRAINCDRQIYKLSQVSKAIKLVNGIAQIIKQQSGFLLLFLGSDLATGVGDLHSDLLSSLHNLCSFLNEELFTLELTLWAISAQKVLLFISRTSKSVRLRTTNFLRPLGR